jgi:hypothetical protein
MRSIGVPALARPRSLAGIARGWWVRGMSTTEVLSTAEVTRAVSACENTKVELRIMKMKIQQGAGLSIRNFFVIVTFPQPSVFRPALAH